METVRVYETFVSIQGESTWAGCPCFFIRLAGCNLRCRYCDTAYAWVGGREVSVEALAQQADAAGVSLVEVTGGEPLLQPGFADLGRALLKKPGRTLLVETNGSQDIGCVPDGIRRIVDVKCPGSGAEDSFRLENIPLLAERDEVKFVLTDRADFDWACQFVRTHGLVSRVGAVLFSPVHGSLEPGTLAGWILESRLAVRLQVQLQKWIRVR